MSSLGIINNDPYLEPYHDKLVDRYNTIINREKQLIGTSKSLLDFAEGHNFFGLHKLEEGWIFREWAPNATNIHLVGECSDWKISKKFRFSKTKAGEWELKLPTQALNHSEHYKLWIEWNGGADYRIPLYAKSVVQDPDTKLFDARVWDPAVPYNWKNPQPADMKNKPLLIYEAHVGMGTSEKRVGSYTEFSELVLPRILKLGYNTVQLMAIQEHPYYGSFGYHVSSFFAPTSRFGTPEELKTLVDKAHGMGIRVIMDLVHSHAVKNSLEGPGLYDGSPGMLFHTDHRREHVAWDSLCFDYGKDEVNHFLLSNCKYWMEEFHFDGFRFDGVTSMLYQDHGLERAFSGYDDYFSDNNDDDAIQYLALANRLIHKINPHAISIAEDMSGMPGLGVPIDDGGLGFDYRLAMGVPDFWIKMIKEKKDEDWKVDELFHELSNYRRDEKVIAYTESHDQALVGDKTIIFRLADKEMYTHMSIHTPSLIIDRAISLHKMIRLITLATNGGGYLNFMGNEFGHPEWIDFPREGNNWSYKYARRQWSLADNQDLKYRFLEEFDKEMIHIWASHALPKGLNTKVLHSNPNDQVLAFERDGMLFVFNFNPTESFTNYGISAMPADYRILLNSDSSRFGGFDRVNEEMIYEPVRFGGLGSEYQLQLYLPNRTALIFKTIPTKRIR